MTKEVMAVEEKTKAVALAAQIDDFDGVDVEAKDLALARILLMQGISEQVAERKANIGDFMNSMTNTVVGGAGKPIQLLPFFVKKSYVVEKYNGTKYQFSHILDDKGGEPLVREYENAQGKFRNMHQYDFFCMTPEMDMPVQVSFRSTAHNEGKKLFNYMYVLQRNSKPVQPPFGNWITLDASVQKNDQGTYMVWSCSPSSVSSEDQRMECRKWRDLLKVAQVNTAPIEKESEPSSMAKF